MVHNIEKISFNNIHYRYGLYTVRHCQVVVMALKPKEELRAEIQSTTVQFQAH